MSNGVYIASKYARRFELRAVADALRQRGYVCTSRWLDNGEEEAGGPAAAAQMDLADVDRASVVLFVGQPQGSKNTGGGRWFELGYAYASGKRCMVVVADPAHGVDHSLGSAPGHETVFTSLPMIEVYGSVDAALERLASQPLSEEVKASQPNPLQ